MRPVRLALLTWNVGGAPAGIAPGTSTLLRCAANADVIIVGLQEVSVGRRGWKTHLAKALGDRWQYVGGESLAGIRLKAFARVSEGKPYASVAAAGMKVGAGFAARWPNKGAVAVEMRFSPTCRVLFVVAHLAANEDQLAERAEDWRAILKRLDRDSLPRNTDPVIPLCHRYEHVFVLGDLNYRIEPPGTDRARRVEWVQQHVDARDWPALLAADQLTRERQAARVFANFQEAPINFPPTFKIDPRTGRYSSARVPSYCDRILWHSLPARVDFVTNRRYEPLPEFRQSDHVPVVAEFDLVVPPAPRPSRNLSLPKGLRPVLEFRLVRFVKGKRSAERLRRHQMEHSSSPLRRLAHSTPLVIPQLVIPDVEIPDVDSLQRLVESFADIEPVDENEDNGNQRDDDDDDDDNDDTIIPGEHSQDEYDLDEVDDEDEDVSSTSTDSHDSRDEHYSNNFEDGSDLYSPYEGAEAVGTTTHRPPTPLRIPTRRPKSNLAHRSSGEMSSAFDEELLADMFTRMSASASSSTDNSTPGTTPTIRRQDRDIQSQMHSNSGGSGTSDGTSGGLSVSPERNDIDRELEARHVSQRLLEYRKESPAHAHSAPRQRDSLSRQAGERHTPNKSRRRARLNGMRMEVHGHGLFLKRDRVYKINIPKRRNGSRERIGDSLPVIPLAPVSSLEELAYQHVVVVFARQSSNVGTSGTLPLRDLVPFQGEPYSFEMVVTKYGRPVGIIEACVQLTVREAGCWVDSRGRVVRNFDGGSAKGYRGSLHVRKRTRARTKPDHVKRR